MTRRGDDTTNRYLGREDAPFGGKTWVALDETMKAAAKSQLTGRRLLHAEGPYGLGLKAVPLQDTEVEPGLIASSFISLSLIQTSFTLSKRDLAAYERDPVVLNTGSVAQAAIECTRLEDTLIFKGAQSMAGLLTTKVALLVRSFGHATTETWVVTPWGRFVELAKGLKS